MCTFSYSGNKNGVWEGTPIYMSHSAKNEIPATVEFYYFSLRPIWMTKKASLGRATACLDGAFNWYRFDYSNENDTRTRHLWL